MFEVCGTIFNIQKFSLNDGPGIRTVVFLKGCPLRCKWCANPESQSRERQLLWDAERCLHCGACAECCPAGALRFEGPRLVFSGGRCVACRSCESLCPAGALEGAGEIKTVSQVLELCLQDRDFYEESGGGITLSGGEPLVQPEFCAALLKALKSEGLHIAMETTGYASPETFQAATHDVDLLLFDLKHYKKKNYREGTGADFNLIWDNLTGAVSRGQDILLRLPVIPGFNDSPEDAKGFSHLLHKIGLTRIQLLPFHQFGENKYVRLGVPYSFAGVSALHEVDLIPFRQILREQKIDAFF